MELYNINSSSAISNIVDEVVEHHPEISRQLAKKLIINALIYECVIDEITGQVDFLIDKLSEEGEI